VQVSLQVPVWGLLKNRSVLCQGLQKDVLIDWWRMSCGCTILFSFLYSERDLEIEMQVEPWEVVGPPHGTKRWGQWQRRNKDMSSEARGGEAFLCVLASQVPSTEGLWWPVGNFQLLIILKYIPQLQTLMSLDCFICYLSSAKNVITRGRRGRSSSSWVLCVNQYGFDWSWVVAAKQVFCKRDWFHAMFKLYLWIFSTIKEHATAQKDRWIVRQMVIQQIGMSLEMVKIVLLHKGN